jgi:DNA polymerase I-like protein with 3'-5' exonuclease and polymerase domains
MDSFKFPNIKKMFVPDEGYTFFDLDLDTADPRVVAWESGCKWMKQCFAAGLKIYVELAKEYYRDPKITKAHPKYRNFKALCNATNYLGEAAGVAGRVGLLVHEVDKAQKWYYQVCPEVKVWQDNLIETVDKKRLIRNAWGYQIKIFERPDAATYRECVAWIPQSTIAILINHGYVNVDKHLKDVHVLLQTHDSLSGQFPTYGGRDWKKEIVEQCTVPVPYPDPLIIPVGIKSSLESWGDCQ